MSAKVILSAKPLSQPFEDRSILLDVPAKIGRSHKEDQVRRVAFVILYLYSLLFVICQTLKIVYYKSFVTSQVSVIGIC
jgi:hypothetical protein